MHVIQKLPDNVFTKIKKIIKDKSKDHNKNLAGNIREEYALHDYIKDIEKPLLNLLSSNQILQEHLKTIDVLNYPLELCLDSLWVNYQKKHEFNPYHHHDGVFSFVVFVQIPYLWEEQAKLGPGLKGGDSNLPGVLQILEFDSTGEPIVQNKFVDKTWEGKIISFPSKTPHIVYPFYGTDEYRITVSGNICFNVKGVMTNGKS